MYKITFLFFFITAYTFGQEYTFDIHEISLSKIIEIEKNIGSKRIQNESRYYSGKGIAQPIRFQRKENKIPDCIIKYQFYEKDSVLTEIEYEWDVYNFEKNDNNQKTLTFEKAMIKKYETLKEMVSKKFGRPKIESNYSNLAKYKQNHFFEESSTWDVNDSTIIKISTTISNYYEKEGAVTINPTHRIRFNIINTSKNEDTSTAKLDEKKLSELEKIKTDFFKALKAKNFTKSKEFLSELILEKVTDEQINMLIDNINFDKETKLVYSGIQMGLDGSLFTILQYKYFDDNSNPSVEIIKLTFDDKNKVVGIQPIKQINNK
jgi:hypothetical protein